MDTEPPLLEPAELMEHMELFLEPREEGEEGGVWKMTPPSLVLMSLSTWSGRMVNSSDIACSEAMALLLL